MSQILIIEDDESIASLVRDYLEINGFSVIVAHDGKEGLKVINERSIDLLILDLTLPGIDGFEICKEIRPFYDIPIIIISAKEGEYDKVRALGLGATDYLVKPFNPGELIARVKAQLSNYARLKANINGSIKTKEVSIRDLKVLPDAKIVYLNGKEVKVTAKEFEILLLLIQHPNQVFSKEQILQHVWGYDTFSDPNTIPVHIKKLREKLEKYSPGDEYIQTKWGLGYRLIT
ncbi:response regulator transcription factor [Paenibacillus montanisoli]|uniref:DNA-binding response regulator n=1 Tax=Paenibacillus montanisoli TaxID=2081970 RepID=A0A328TVM7_9BACL|nr:response regulator transcription factor [Paenibacillus montanisoli]RAP73692.1 DNA-binding response regulator [Paenibacillus montanisoli]